MHRHSLFVFNWIAFVAGIAALAGCASEDPRVARDRGTAGAPMTSSGELATPNPKPMDAQATFFAGGIGVEVMLAKSDAVWKNARPADGERPSGRRGGGGGFNAGIGGGGGGRRGGDPELAGTNRDETGPRAPNLRASNAPPVQLRLRLTNRGSTPVDVEVLDFNSDLGNFVVGPKKITLPPAESVEADPMTSRLGVPALAQIPLTVRMRVDGKTEQQTLALRPRQEESEGAPDNSAVNAAAPAGGGNAPKGSP